MLYLCDCSCLSQTEVLRGKRPSLRLLSRRRASDARAAWRCSLAGGGGSGGAGVSLPALRSPILILTQTQGATRAQCVCMCVCVCVWVCVCVCVCVKKFAKVFLGANLCAHPLNFEPSTRTQSLGYDEFQRIQRTTGTNTAPPQALTPKSHFASSKGSSPASAWFFRTAQFWIRFEIPILCRFAMSFCVQCLKVGICQCPCLVQYHNARPVLCEADLSRAASLWLRRPDTRRFSIVRAVPIKRLSPA